MTAALLTLLTLEAFTLYLGQRLIFGQSFLYLGKLPAYLLAAPGTILHELAHLLACKLLGVPVGEVSLFRPRQTEDGSITLGYVMHAESDPLRGALVAIAPLLFVPPLLLSVTVLLLGAGSMTDLPDALSNAAPWKVALWLYVSFSAGQGAFPSTGDRIGVLGSLALAALTGVLLLIVPPGSWEAVLKTLTALLALPSFAAIVSLAMLRVISQKHRR